MPRTGRQQAQFPQTEHHRGKCKRQEEIEHAKCQESSEQILARILRQTDEYCGLDDTENFPEYG